MKLMKPKLMLMLCMILLMQFTAQSQNQVPPQAIPLTQQATSTTPTTEYVLQRGDDIEIRAYDLPELNAVARIRPDGKISVLLLNDVDAAGLTVSKLNQNLTEGYANHFRNPRVTVIARSFAAQNVFVGGEVATPTAVPLPGNMTAMQAIVRAGGLKGTAENVLILRDIEKGTPRVESLNVRDILENQKPDVLLQPSDVVYVPKNTVSIYVGGEVARPGMIELTGDMTILSAVFQAGGFLQSAKTDGVVLVRNENNAPVKTKIRLDDVFLADSNTALKPYDVVFVPKSKIARLDQWVDQHIKQLNPFSLSFGFSYIFGNGSGQPFPIIF
jgi:protein involved in polysaccharide export with SLBB domain